MDEFRQIRPDLQIEVPEAMRVGVPADLASVWHTPETLVIDFLSVVEPPRADDQGRATLPVTVAARVRMPPTHVIELMRALEAQLSAWEIETGRLPAVEPPHPDLGR